MLETLEKGRDHPGCWSNRTFHDLPDPYTVGRAGGSFGLRHPEYALSSSMLRVYLEATGIRW
jgi:hypothetical protein